MAMAFSERTRCCIVLMSVCLLAACTTDGQGVRSTTDVSPDSMHSGSYDARPATTSGKEDIKLALVRAANDAWEARNWRQAVEYYGILYKGSPNNAAMLVRYAESLRRSGAAGTAVSVLTPAALAESPASDILVAFSKANLQAGRPQIALDAARHAVRQAPETADSYIVLGVVLDALGDHDGAMEAYQSSLKYGATETGRVLSNLGLSLAQSGRMEEAINTLRRARRLDPSDPSISLNLRLVERLAEEKGVDIAKTSPIRPLMQEQSQSERAVVFTPDPIEPVPLAPAPTFTPRERASVAPRVPTTAVRIPPPARVAAAPSNVPNVRWGRHGKFDRLVLNEEKGFKGSYSRNLNRLTVPLPTGISINANEMRKIFVRSVSDVEYYIQDGRPLLEFTLRSGARIREWRLDKDRYLLDIYFKSY
ncbi:MAG: tetratricopeptide repeat protein [Pseudomonadota bacterium]|nr:tetratricopeptide repeat protein [Pseudomonadota bacterium]